MKIWLVCRSIGIAFLLPAIGSGPAFAAEKPEKDADEPAGAAKEKSGTDTAPPLVVTEHEATIGGKKIRYRATAGYLVLKDESDGDADKKSDDKSDDTKDPDGLKPKARIFFVAYTLIGADVAKRPVTFSFNGGPGSSSVWLHLGALGPKRVALQPDGSAPPPPYQLVNNDSSWLDRTDLVFIDPVSTGFSRPVPGEKADPYHGFEADLKAVADFIRLYLTKNDRWLSPKFVIGESYGGLRAAGLTARLQEKYGISLNGVILLSPVINYQTIDFSAGNDVPYVSFLPGYTAAAWYHKRLAPDQLARPLADVLAESEDFAGNDYLLALAKGQTLTPEERTRIATRLAALTGLERERIEQLNLRVPSWLFFTRLLDSENRLIGRYDARYTGVRSEPGTDGEPGDPSFDAVQGPMTAGINSYLRQDLKFETEVPYEILADVWPWKFDPAENRYLNVSEDLRKVMGSNPYLQVWFIAGRYDLATPYFSTEYSANQLLLDPSLRDHVTLSLYEGGHMMYVVDSVREQLKADFGAFLDRATNRPPIDTAARR